MIRQTKISRTILMAMSILLAAAAAAQENTPDPATRRPGVITPAADLSGTYGDVVVEGDATYFASGVLLKPKSTRPWTADLIGGTTGGFTVINSARTKQLLTIFDNGNTVLRGGQTPLAVYGDSTPVGGFLVYDGASMGLPPGGVNVQITGPSVLLAGGLQLGLGGGSIINSVNSQPLYLNPWVNYDTIVGNSADATSGLKVVSRGASYFTGRLGIGTAAPLSQLHVVETDTGWPRGIILDHITQDGTAAFIMGRKARGTPAAPTIVSTGDNIMAITPGAYDGTSAYMSLTRMLFTVDGPVSAGNAPMAVRFTSGATSEIERMRITSAGNVGIGTATPNPAYLLDVAGNANFSGTVTGGNIKAKYQDVAEWVPTTERLTAGTVVVLDAAHANHVVASSRPYDTTVAGVISAQPGLVLGEESDSKAMVATTGRVLVRVDATKNPIAIGDLLVTGLKPGRAMKSIPMDLQGVPIHRPGTVVGKALEPLAGGEGEILVLLSLQ